MGVLAPYDTPRKMGLLRTYVALLLLAFLAGLALSPWPPVEARKLLFFGLLTALLARLSVPLPLVGQIRLHYLGALAMAYTLPPGWAALLSALALPLSSRPPDPLREAYNRNQVGLAALLAAHAYGAVEGLPGALLGAGTYFGVNTGAMLVLSWLLKGLPPKEAWRKNYAPYGATYLLTSPVALLAARLYEVPVLTDFGPLDVAVLLLPVVYLRHMWLLRRRVEEATLSMLRGMVRSLEARDPYTALHSERVTAIALDLARELGLSESERETLALGARLHDIGKVGVRDEVLLKTGKLTEEEWEEMRLHPEIGLRILHPMLPHLGPIEGIVLHHHERWDGRGYPKGLRGEEIPRLARIVAVADAYEAMTSDRPYRKGLSPEEAAEVVRKEAGKQFDPEVAEAFLRVWRRAPTWRTKGDFTRASREFGEKTP